MKHSHAKALNGFHQFKVFANLATRRPRDTSQRLKVYMFLCHHSMQDDPAQYQLDTVKINEWEYYAVPFNIS